MKNIRKFDEFKNENYVAEPESWTNLSSMFSGILDKGKEALKKGKEGFEEALEKGKEAVSDVADGAEDMFDGALDTVKGWFGIPSTDRENIRVSIDENNLIFADKIAGMIDGDKEQREFKDKLISGCKEMGIKPNWLLWVIWKECRFRPNIKNPNSSARGLIQFISSSAKSAGTSSEALRTLTPIQQLPFVFNYLKSNHGKEAKSVEELYLCVFAPGNFKNRKDPNGIASKHGLGNPAVDNNKDGVIKMSEFISYATKGMPQAYKNLC